MHAPNVKIMVPLPFIALYMLAYSGVWYGMSSLRPGAAFGRFYCIIALLQLVTNQVSQPLLCGNDNCAVQEYGIPLFSWGSCSGPVASVL